MHAAAMGRNVRALVLSCESHEVAEGDNARRARDAEAWQSREAQFDIEGAICWRDPHARRCAR